MVETKSLGMMVDICKRCRRSSSGSSIIRSGGSRRCFRNCYEEVLGLSPIPWAESMQNGAYFGGLKHINRNYFGRFRAPRNCVHQEIAFTIDKPMLQKTCHR